MDLVGRTYGHIFLGMLLVPLMGLDGSQGSCPTTCRCSLEILNCSRITNLPGFHRVPLPSPPSPPPPFTYLDFTGNEISSVGKEVWKAYPWAEHLLLKGNSLTRLQNTSLEGLLSLTYLDLSCNKIQMIGTNAFEAVPFLQIINLSGNNIQQIAYGAFRAWHGLQFLQKVDLSHNPLAAIRDSHFYSLPSLKFLDLGVTEITPKVLEDLLQTTLQLKTLILPQKMSCGLCCIKEDVEASCNTVKMECTESCAVNATLCHKEPLNRMQEEVMKAFEFRKMNGSSLLNILPERAIRKNRPPEPVTPSKDTLALADKHSSLVANFNLLESLKQLMQVKTDEDLDVNWADKGELKKLYLLASLLKEALKRRILELDRHSLEASLQNVLSPQASKTSADEAATESMDAFFKKERHVREAMRQNWPGTRHRQKDTLVKLGRDGQEVADTTRPSADQPDPFELHNMAGRPRKLVEGLDSQHTLPFHRSHQAALQSFGKRSIPDTLTEAIEPTVTDDNHNDLASLSNDRNPMAMSGNGFGAHTLTKEKLLQQLLHRKNSPAKDGKFKITAIDSEPSLNELSPDIKVSSGTDWEHKSTSVSPPLYIMAQQDNYFPQRERFEAELNKRLTSLIQNTPVRKLISHVIRILEMDCSTPIVQKVCANLISKTGLLMKLLSEREKAKVTSSLWNTYFWPAKNITNTTTESSRKLEKPLGKTINQGIPAYMSTNKELWAVSITALIMIIISVILLIEICSQHPSSKHLPLLGKRKPSLQVPEDSRTDSPLGNPLWLKDMCQTQDETQITNMISQLHDEESQEEVYHSKTLLVPMNKVPSPSTTIPPPSRAPSITSQKSSVKKSSGRGAGSSVAVSSKAASSVVDEEEKDEDEEESTEKSEAPTTTATSEAGEMDEEEEEED